MTKVGVAIVAGSLSLDSSLLENHRVANRKVTVAF